MLCLYMMEPNCGICVQVECRYSDYFVCEAPLLTTMKDAIVVKVNGTLVDVQGFKDLEALLQEQQHQYGLN